MSKIFRAIVALLVGLCLAQVQQANAQAVDLRQNFEYCRDGYTTLCNRSLLTTEQQSVAAAANRRQNFEYCRDGYTTLCNRSLLTPEQQSVVTSANLRQNFEYCRDGYTTLCNRSLLTAEQRQRVTAGDATKKTSGVTGAVCAENGSCYGDISEGTGRPKTVEVQGYYRKDGTYVRGHYRSPPRKR